MCEFDCSKSPYDMACMQQRDNGAHGELESERKNVQELVVKMREVENEMSSHDRVGVLWRAKERMRV